MGKVYDVAYKNEICKRAVSGGMTVPQMSKETGINEQTLYTWVQKYRKSSETPFVGSGNILPENEETVRLRRECKDLREENEILKKAAAYFARNQK